jgi:hypothetical protein
MHPDPLGDPGYSIRTFDWLLLPARVYPGRGIDLSVHEEFSGLAT